MRLVFLGSPPFATPVLGRLAASLFRPLLVVTPPGRPQGRGRKLVPSPVAALARAEGIDVCEPVSVRDEAVLARLRALAADVFLVVAYGELLRPEFLALPRIECLNVHPSLLPRHRGASPIPAAILAGDGETGVSILRVVRQLDAGDVLVQKTTAIQPGETAGELAGRLAELAGDVALEALAKVDRGELDWTPQDPARATLCRKLTKEAGRIDWSLAAVGLDRHVRAMNPWPLARTTLPAGTGLAVHRARPLAAPPPLGAPPGTILEAAGRLVVACGAGQLELLLVQADGKRPLGAAEFLRGARLATGERLGG
ncbi:MAG: methionyl-tRNA formyltransferase [Planctomycetota bacterium]